MLQKPAIWDINFMEWRERSNFYLLCEDKTRYSLILLYVHIFIWELSQYAGIWETY